MAIEYTTTGGDALKEFEGASDVYVQAELTCKNTENSKSTSLNVAFNMEGFDPSSGFTPYKDVTDEQLVTWAKASLPDWMLAQMEADVA